MTNQELIDEVVKLYRDAKGVYRPYRNDNVSRGRARIISSLCEDLMAFFLSQRIAKRYE